MTHSNQDLYRETFENKKVLITGGLGFIGSNLARALVPLGADVLLVDSLIPDYGGNLFNIADIDWALQGVLEALEPTGFGNATPIFVSRDLHVYDHRAVGQDGSHLQLWVGDGRVKRSCIAFRQGAWAGRLPGQVDLAYTLNVNEWNGRRDLQLVVKDIREAEGL